MKAKSTININIRCTPKEKKLLKELSKKAGLTISDYIKNKALGRKVEIRVSTIGIEEV